MNTTSPRFFSLDVLRGITVCFMIIVNTSGNAARPFAFLSHARWNGFTPADLVFPTFLFVVGNAMSFTVPRYASLGNRVYLKKVCKRTFLIFLLGFLMYWFPFCRQDVSGRIEAVPFSDTRVFGVLQRIALCYFLASLMIRYFSEKWVYSASIILLAGYWAALWVWGDPGDPLSLQSNAVYKLDHFLLGDRHLYHGNGGKAFDPEGLLSTFPAVVNVIAGYYTGRYLRNKGIGFEVIAKILLSGVVLIFAALIWNGLLPINKKLWTGSFVLITIGLDLMILSSLVYITDDPEGLLSTFPAVVNVIAGYYTGRYLRNKGIGFEVIAKILLSGVVLIFAALIWNGLLPINKKLWTGSFVLITIGLDLMILSSLVYITDICHRRKWAAFFIPFGKNPLFIYLLSEILVIFLYVIPTGNQSNLYHDSSRFFCRILPGSGGSLLFALSYMLLCWCVGWWLDKRKVYIKV